MRQSYVKDVLNFCKLYFYNVVSKTLAVLHTYKDVLY